MYIIKDSSTHCIQVFDLGMAGSCIQLLRLQISKLVIRIFLCDYPGYFWFNFWSLFILCRFKEDLNQMQIFSNFPLLVRCFDILVIKTIVYCFVYINSGTTHNIRNDK